MTHQTLGTAVAVSGSAVIAAPGSGTYDKPKPPARSVRTFLRLLRVSPKVWP